MFKYKVNQSMQVTWLGKRNNTTPHQRNRDANVQQG
jgi:hypothetical protein